MYEVEIDGSIVSVAARLARFTGEAGFPGMANSLTSHPPNIANSCPSSYQQM